MSESGPLLLPHCQQRKEGKRNVCFRIAVLGDQQKTNNLLLLQDSRKKKEKEKTGFSYIKEMALSQILEPFEKAASLRKESVRLH